MFTINIDSSSSVPMYEQIYEYIKNEIKSGQLPPKAKLPSTRSLAIHMQVSRNTIDMAYAQLLSEGYIESIPKSGYYVSMVSELTHIAVKKTTVIPVKSKKEPAYQYDFSPYAIDINSFPYNIWRKLSNTFMNNNNNDIFLLGNNQGDEGLRAAIGRYLHESRGVNCTTEQIIIGAGADYLLQLLTQILQYSSTNIDINNNSVTDENVHSNKECVNIFSGNIAMENPTYMQAYKIFKTMHYEVTPIPLDSSGISMDHLSKIDSNIVYVTPSHQYPLGIVMPIKRRLELLQWANSSPDRYIIEDDHDSEFRYKGKPIPSLQGIDSSSKVIYLGTFSRAIAPAIRIGYMVLPEKLLEIYKKNFNFYSSTVSRVDQNIMKSFIEGGYFERHLNKTRKIYKNKHDLLIQNLKIFGDTIRIEGENAGLHLIIRFNTQLTEKEIIDLAAKGSTKLYGLNEHYFPDTESENPTLSPLPPTILLGYANMPEEDIKKGIEKLYCILRAKLGSTK